jgi:collagen type III alpha
MAGAVVQRANAQADYGYCSESHSSLLTVANGPSRTHNGNNGSPDGDFGGNSGGSPSSSVNNDPNGISYGNPSGFPNGAPAGLPGNSPGSTSDMPTCALQGITTVFVTVYPTSHVTPSGLVPLVPSGAAQSNGFDPNQTIQQSAFPASTVLISPIQSAQAAHTSVKPFTTVTIDVWGSGGDPSDAFTSNISPVPVSTDGASDPVQSSAGFPDGSSAFTHDPDSFNSNLGDHYTPSSSQATAGNGPSPGSFPTVTPENAAYGNADGLNSIPNTFNQQPSEYSSPTATVAGLDGSQPAQITVVGPDGKLTIVQFPGTQIGNSNGNGASQPFSTAPPFTGFPTGVSATSDVLATARETLCTSYTILGPNGVPTVVHSTWVDLPTTAASLPTSVPSGFSPNPSVVTGLPDGPVIATQTTFTILGPNGLPTVVESSWLVAAPTNTLAGIPGSTSVNGFPNQVTGTAAAVGGSGSTTCTSYTVLGLDGLPTVVDTTWVIPSPTNNAIPSAIITGIPTQAGGVSGSTPQITTDLGVNAITTCTSYTVLGADGAPTVVESTFVIPASNLLPTVARGLPLPPAQTADFPEGISNLPEASNLATTCITVGVVGPNGFTTPVVQTVLIPTGGLSNALPAQTSLGYPSLVPAQTGLPQGGLSITPGSGLFTTCITVTTVGLDGMATPVIQTVVGIPSGAELGTAVAPLSTGVPSFPNPNFSSGTLLGLPTLSQYGTLGNGLPSVLPPSAVVSGVVEPTGTVTGTRTSTLTVTNGPNGQLPSLVPYDDQWNSQAPEYGLPGSSRLATALQTSTWTNVIPEQTTTYSINFPLTTMATVTLPNLRVFRRQQK